MKRTLIQIQNKGATSQVLGALLKTPTLLLDSNYHISGDDFPEKFHGILFSCINNLFNSGVVTMDIPTICNYLYSFPNQLSIFEGNSGTEYVENIRRIADVSNFESNYNMLKKFTVLRDLHCNGQDIREIYDFNESDPKEMEKMQDKIHAMTSIDIINHFMLKINDIASRHEMENIGVQKVKAGDRVRDVIEAFGRIPDIGMKLYNEWYNTVFRGARLRKFYLETASSGTGKSRRQIREATFMSVPMLYNLKTKEWEHTGIIPQKTTYICTELEEDEIIPIAVAFLSGVDEEKIKLGTMDEDEKNRVLQAICLMEEHDNFHFVTISDFDIDDIERIILDKILREGCKYFFFDYIHSTAKSLSYYGKKTGVKLQEHQILFLMAVSLKAICQKYDIFLYSATQTNQSGMSGEARDEQALRGSKAIADKVDGGIVLTRASKLDEENLQELILSNYGKKPTHCTAIYKNRGGSLRGVYLWSKMSLANMREEYLFATDENYVPISIKMLEIIMVKEDEKEEEVITDIFTEIPEPLEEERPY